MVLITAAAAIAIAVWWAFTLYRRFSVSANRTAENLAEFTAALRDEELAHKLSLLFDQLRNAAENVAGASRELQQFLANEEFVALPAESRHAIARFHESMKSFTAALNRVDAYLKLPEQTKQKLDLLKQVVSAVGAGIAAGWEDLRGKKGPKSN